MAPDSSNSERRFSMMMDARVASHASFSAAVAFSGSAGMPSSMLDVGCSAPSASPASTTAAMPDRSSCSPILNFESTLVMATPTSPPSREGNSYDTNDIAMAGMTQLQMESRMKSQLRASTLYGTRNEAATTGRKCARMLMMSCTFQAISWNLSGSSSKVNSPENPNQMGVPTPPNGVARVFMMRAVTTTRKGSCPSWPIIGAASATGVPKPEAPSIRYSKAHRMRNTSATG
mmetsp:Transcript_46006/g.85853  ORF Transcript_46006/g.85853 Transcript_46006/m.85853 type:complete len:232 (+) Transcript_46006:2246-2941(+)